MRDDAKVALVTGAAQGIDAAFVTGAGFRGGRGHDQEDDI